MIGERIKTARKALGYENQKGFADTLNIPFRTLQSYEQGSTKEIPHSFFIKLNEQHHVSIDWVMTGKGSMIEGRTKEEKIKEILDILHELPEKSVEIMLLEAKKEKIRNE